MIHSYKTNLLHRLRITRGHFDKVIKMIEADEYCLDITQQTYAIQMAIKKVEGVLLEHHLKTCVKDAIMRDKNVDDKVREILEVFKRK
ncbi:metal-sensitive transcriptional regulator [Candidatus Roizmanbacteria bacterium]|nr:metal-sensitive transcriptional regulator [Candidatus Roizmanbacteria bacterium]